MKRTVYEAPVTELFRVELEGNFCASAEVENPNADNGRIEEHGINGSFGGDFSDNQWGDPIVGN